MHPTKISRLTKIVLIIGGIFLAISIILPIWRIELDAPQYPEGLTLLIYAHSLGGNVDIINGLNHYIGMKTLHAEEFVEFKVLPYIIAMFALLSMFTAFIGRKKLVYALLALFILFGIVAMIDFWRWEYDYGHNLNPEAAIIVPGMAYQPPLIGFKQLLNFGAYSIPDIGGWLFIASGLLMVFSTLIETGMMKNRKTSKHIVSALALMLLVMSCSADTPRPIKLNKDHCDFCKMTISNGHMATEIKTKKGRTYTFDDMACMLHYMKENKSQEISALYVNDFISENILIDATNAFFIRGEQIESPMGGHIAAFKNKDAAQPFLQKYGAEEITWQRLQH